MTATPGGDVVSGATVTILDGPKAGTTTTTDASGNYSFADLPIANINMKATASGFADDARGTFVNGTNSLNFSLVRPVWTRSGSGPDVWQMPFWVNTVKITATYTGNCENFIVYVSGKLVVNELVGGCGGIGDGTTYSGTFLVTAGQVQIQKSSLVNYTFTEVR